MVASLALFGLLVQSPSQAKNPLRAYVQRPDSAYRYESKLGADGNETISLTSQVWQGFRWEHQILLRQPKQSVAPGVAILYITGDGPRPGDYNQIGLLTAATGMPVATLFSIPNQPLEGRKEDDLIAHTFEKFLETGDESWPLLFPMAKSAVRAMDAVVSATKGSPNPITRFVVTGASKRGWTTWMVGALGDKRVIGIAPMVIDNLNVSAQMKHQIDSWGKYSEQIDDYTRRGLQAKMASPAGRRLTEIVDPYTYRRDIKVPTLIVKGANDRYWTVDALDQYWSGLKMPKWIRTVPNAGHDLGGGLQAIESIGAFARSVAGAFPMPKIDWALTPAKLSDGRPAVEVEFTAKAQFPKELKIWVATSDSLDFRDSKYVLAHGLSIDQFAPGGEGFENGTHRVPLTAGRNAAVFAEFRYEVGGRSFSLTSNTLVIRK